MYSNFVSTKWLEEHLNDDNLRIIDATTEMMINNTSISGKEAYAIGHIPNAMYVNIQTDFSDDHSPYAFTYPSVEKMINSLARLGISQYSKIIIYDYSAGYESIWASRLWWQLKSLGLSEVFVLEGGYRRWLDEKRPVAKKLRKFKPVEKIKPLNQPPVSKNDVLTILQENSSCLIHSLSDDSYAGSTNDFGRPGHIPTSLHVFFKSHMTEQGELKPIEEVKNNFIQAGVPLDGTPIITYCGRGIAATWNLLLLHEIGIENVNIYDGSMVEWAQDETLPLTSFGQK